MADRPKLTVLPGSSEPNDIMVHVDQASSFDNLIAGSYLGFDRLVSRGRSASRSDGDEQISVTFVRFEGSLARLRIMHQVWGGADRFDITLPRGKAAAREVGKTSYSATLTVWWEEAR
jgi:hypothetical protein